jgi:hypothetical protein
VPLERAGSSGTGLPRFLKLLAPIAVKGSTLEIYAARDKIVLSDVDSSLLPFLSAFSGWKSTEEILGDIPLEQRDDAYQLIQNLVLHSVLVPSGAEHLVGFWTSVALAPASGRGEPRNTGHRLLSRSEPRMAVNPTADLSAHGAISSILSSMSSKARRLMANPDIEFDACVLENTVDGFAVSRWDALGEELLPLPGPASRREVEHAVDQTLSEEEVMCIVVICADVTSSETSSRSYRFAHLFAGWLLAWAQEAASERGYTTAVPVEYRDLDLAKLLKTQYPLAVLIVSKPRSTLTLEPRGAAWLIDWLKTIAPSTVVEPENGGRSLGVAIAQNEIPTVGTVRFASGSASTTRVAEVRAAGETFERLAASRLRVDWTGSRRDLDRNVIVPKLEGLYFPSALAYTQPNAAFRPFVPDAEYDWVFGRKPDGSVAAVPIEFVFYPLPASQFSRPLIARASSSGLAAGDSWESASNGALLELIERDSYVRAWLSESAPSVIRDLPDGSAARLGDI